MTNTFRNLTLGLLSTLSIVAPSAQAGYQYEGIQLMEGSDFGQYSQLAGDMINSLNHMGVPVIDGGYEKLPICQPEGDSYTLGYYVPSQNYMVICTNVSNHSEQFETLTHEVVHVIQDARTGINNDSLHAGSDIYLRQLVNGLPEYKVNTIASLYDESDWDVEVEAFYFETRPQEVASELRKFAF